MEDPVQLMMEDALQRRKKGILVFCFTIYKNRFKEKNRGAKAKAIEVKNCSKDSEIRFVFLFKCYLFVNLETPSLNIRSRRKVTGNYFFKKKCN